MKARTRARGIALQALYEIDMVDHPPVQVLQERLEDEPQTEELAEFIRQILFGVLPLRDPLDLVIARYAPEWPLDQMARIDVNILRLGIYELAIGKPHVILRKDSQGNTLEPIEYYFKVPYFGSQLTTSSNYGSSFWLLDEPTDYDDYMANAFFLNLARKGWTSANAPDVKFAYRVDVSQPEMSRGLWNNICDLWVLGGGTLRNGYVTTAAIRQKWLPEAMQFLQTNRAELNRKPFAAFLVCGTLAMPKAEEYKHFVAGFLEPVRELVTPLSEGLFAGAVDFSKLALIPDGFSLRLFSIFSKTPEGDYRNWNAIRTWAAQLNRLLETA